MHAGLAMSDVVLALLTCPSCPTQRAAREVFLADDLWLRLGGMIGPFVVTVGLVALFVDKLRRHAGRREEMP